MVSIDLLNNESVDLYGEYLQSHSAALLYHSVKYKNFLQSLLQCGDNYLAAKMEGRIVGVLPLIRMTDKSGFRIFNSLPYYGSNGGILADSKAATEELIQAYNDIASEGATVSATIIENPLLKVDLTGLKYNFTDYRIGQITDIACQHDIRSELLKRIDSSARRNIKKADREGVVVEIDNGQMRKLGALHRANILAIGGLAKSEDFFELVPHHFTSGEDFNLYVARKDGAVIAALLIFYFNKTVEYFTPAVDSQFRSIQPLAAIIISAMTDAVKRGCTRWNWGGTWNSQEGVFRFKKKWGAREYKYQYYTQLNDISILKWPRQEILKAYPDFFVVPFSELDEAKQGEP